MIIHIIIDSTCVNMNGRIDFEIKNITVVNKGSLKAVKLSELNSIENRNLEITSIEEEVNRNIAFTTYISIKVDIHKEVNSSVRKSLCKVSNEVTINIPLHKIVGVSKSTCYELVRKTDNVVININGIERSLNMIHRYIGDTISIHATVNFDDGTIDNICLAL